MLKEHSQQFIGADRLNKGAGFPSRDRFLGRTDALAAITCFPFYFLFHRLHVTSPGGCTLTTLVTNA